MNQTKIMKTQDIFNLPEEKFYEEIKTLTIPELEQLIEQFDKIIRKSDRETKYRMRYCLSRRIGLLTQQFECSPENLERLQNVANLVKTHADILRKKGNELYKRTLQELQDGNHEPFRDFYVELSLNVHFNGEQSVLNLPDDNTSSDYIKMSEILDRFDNHPERNLFLGGERIDYDPEILEKSLDLDDDMESHNGNPYLWEGFGRKFPELQRIPITWEFHQLLDHTNYALQDIIRINDVWGEVKVCWQHITSNSGKKQGQ